MGYKTVRGGKLSITPGYYPYKNEGGKSFSYAEGGGDKKFWGSFNMVLKVLAILDGGGYKQLPFPGGGATNVAVLIGGEGAYMHTKFHVFY